MKMSLIDKQQNMKSVFTLTILVFLLVGCSNNQSHKKPNKGLTKNEENSEEEREKNIEENSEENDELVFKHISKFPDISDSVQFIIDLKEFLHIDSDRETIEEITTYEKIKIYDSNEDYYFIEYDYNTGCGADYPWKHQILFNAEGQLLKILSGQRFQFVEIFENKNPFLLIVDGTSKGNGWHELYKISSNTLENVYMGYIENDIRTYDSHHDNKIFEPYELKFKIKDFNNDGFNDISFYGDNVLIERYTKSGEWFDSQIIDGQTVYYSEDNPFEIIPVEFIFLYDQESGHFKAKED